MALYSTQALLIGPYLPSEDIKIGNTVIKISNEQLKWETPPNPISAQAGGEDESLIVFTPSKVAVNTSATLVYECEAVSSKEAASKAQREFERICDALNVSCIENKYFFQIANIKRLSDGADPESRLSDPIHVVNYEFRLLNKELEDYTKAVLALNDDNARKVVASFGKALRDSDIPGLYKILELITHLLSKEVKATSDIEVINQQEKTVITDLHHLLIGDGSHEQKVKGVKKSAEDLRRLNLEQNGKRIAATAVYLGLKGEATRMIDNAIHYRNKVMAHHDSTIVQDEQKQRGPKDIQESARFFVIQYLSKKFALKLPQLENVPYKDDWYSVTYVNSAAQRTSRHKEL